MTVFYSSNFDSKTTWATANFASGALTIAVTP